MQRKEKFDGLACVLKQWAQKDPPENVPLAANLYKCFYAQGESPLRGARTLTPARSEILHSMEDVLLNLSVDVRLAIGR
jgi:hypothetical protein